MSRPATLLRRIRRDLGALEAIIAAKPGRKRSGARATISVRASASTILPAAPEPTADDTIQIGKERGAVRYFIAEKGKTWKLPGPNPLEGGCLVRAEVIAEYRADLDALAYQLAHPEPEPKLT